MDQVTAIVMAREAGVSAKALRQALRVEKLPWHEHNARWTVVRDSAEHRDMSTVLERLIRRPRGAAR
jgi:hypothetical protein